MNEWKGRKKAIKRIVMVQDDGLCGTVVSGGKLTGPMLNQLAWSQ